MRFSKYIDVAVGYMFVECLQMLEMEPQKNEKLKLEMPNAYNSSLLECIKSRQVNIVSFFYIYIFFLSFFLKHM